MFIKTNIYTIRHGKTQYNSERRYAGTIDIPLSEAGIREVRDAAPKMDEYHLDVVITSTLRRTFETAKILVEGRVPIIRNKLCNERKFGVMEGLTWDEIQDLRPKILLIQVGNDLHTVNPKNGEPFEAVWERAKKFHRFIFRKFKGKDILVVSHGVFLQMLHGVIKGLNCIESLTIYPTNMECNQFHFNDECLIETKTEILSREEIVRW